MPATLPDAAERHRELLEELVDDLFAYMPDAETTLVADAFAYACEHHDGQLRKSGEEYILHPWGVAKVCARLQQPPAVLAAALLHDVVEDTDATSDEIALRFGEDVRLLVDGVTKLSTHPVRLPRGGGGRELPQDDPLDVAGHPRRRDQARRPPAQHADALLPGQAEADPEGQGDPRGLRADRAPARHPLDQVGARGPRVRNALPAQVRRDREDGQRAPGRPRAVRRRGGPRAADRTRTASACTRRWPAARSTSTRSSRR